jgi:hypothetical protein
MRGDFMLTGNSQSVQPLLRPFRTYLRGNWEIRTRRAVQPDDKAQQKLAYNIDKLTTWSHTKALLDKAQYTYWCKNSPRVYGEDLSLFFKGESIDTNWAMIDQSSSWWNFPVFAIIL